ncbi:zinc finger, CCHC-type containing protein [Tanacetum coccineum]|uniref:Zinc finger, CCHC-type containing protein n=1 Tax=Tanacetum coccineum TaxID=301880 RepID=A0ABQ4Z353_9ASTR
MHTTMVPEQVKTIKIQDGIQISRPRELTRQLQPWKRFGRLYLIVFVLVRNILGIFQEILLPTDSTSLSHNSGGCYFSIGAVVRLPDQKLKTLSERDIECIFVGYAEHFKAFRFYVIEPNESVSINSIIESRDAIFDENKFSSVPRPSQMSLLKTWVVQWSLKRLRSNQHSYCFNVEDVPKTRDEAMKSNDVAFWKEAINDEMDSIMVARISTIRLLIAMASIHNLIIHQMDVKTAFFNGELDEEVDLTKEFLSSRFSMKDMGDDDVILGIRIKHKTNGITIPQSHYIKKVLKKFNYFDCTPVNTYMDTSEKLMCNNVGKLSRYTSNPGTQHWLIPSVVNHDKLVESNEVLDKDQPQTTNEPVIQTSSEEQTPSISFPERFRKEKEEAQQRKFLENLKQLHINLPFIESLAQMLKYAKFLKSLLTNKARLEEACTIIMNKRCSAVLLNKLPSKEKDPGSLTIPCDIGQLHINNALADLGASISLMLYTMYEKLGLGEPKATRMSLELADRSDSFLLKGLEKSIEQSDLESFEQRTARPDGIKTEHLYSASANEIDEKRPELKSLPNHLEYAYLQGDKSFSIIISSKLSEKEKILLFQVLEKRKGAIAWKISNIKGISPSFCTHKILMEDDFKPVIQPQRHLNPKVQDVVKNKIVKLLDFGLIYPISDSSWVSPIHVVAKKGGMTVVLNDNNELIPSQTVTGWRVILLDSDRTRRSRKYNIHLSLWEFFLQANVVWIMQRSCDLLKMHDSNFPRHGCLQDVKNQPCAELGKMSFYGERRDCSRAQNL